MEECDTLLLVGTSFPYMDYLPKPGQARAVQIDRDPTRLGIRYPIDVGLTGDAPATLKALLPLLKRRDDRSFLEKAQERMKEWDELMKDRRDPARRPAQAAGGRRGGERSAEGRTRSSRPTRARSRPGRRGTSR